MYGKFIIFTVFFAIVLMQLVQAATPLAPRAGNQNQTKCFTCDSPLTCRSPKPLICDQKTANATHEVLEKHFLNVQNFTYPQFECLKTTYRFKNNTIIDIRGCINVGVNPCTLHPKNSSLITATCKTCKTNLCNPAGTLSSSLSAIMMSLVFGLLLLKFGYF